MGQKNCKRDKKENINCRCKRRKGLCCTSEIKTKKNVFMAQEINKKTP